MSYHISDNKLATYHSHKVCTPTHYSGMIQSRRKTIPQIFLHWLTFVVVQYWFTTGSRYISKEVTDFYVQFITTADT